MLFNFDFSIYVICLLGVAVLFALLSAIFGLKQMRIVACAGRRFPTTLPADEGLTPISVIVYAHNAEGHIERLLDGLLAQDHPQFEVIVVNDASIDNTAELVSNVMERDSRVYLTFVSDSARNISHRKLAYTVGLRAAKYPAALLTTAEVEIPSPSWLRCMAAPFADPEVEVGIGASYVPRGTDRGAGRFWRSFDSLTGETRWLGTALGGRPYRGTACNLAFRPKTFFDHKGFASSNRFQGGEDDIFINEIATPQNTVTVFRPEAMPAVSLPEDEYPRLWKRNKERYAFTAHYLHTGALRMQGFMSLSVWVATGCAVAAAIMGLPNLVPALAALLVLLLMWGDQICVYRRAATAMHSIRLWWSVPLFWLIRPIANACYRAGFQVTKHTNYTWQQPR